jgi:hypothetical protein
MKCFSGVDVLNALLRKVTIKRVDKVDKEGGDATQAFYNRESGPLANGCTDFYLLPGQNDLDLCQGFHMERGNLGVPPFGNSGVATRNQRRSRMAADLQFPNFTIVLRVSVELLVTTAGPPLMKCQAEYCSMYGSSDDRQSIGTMTL